MSMAAMDPKGMRDIDRQFTNKWEFYNIENSLSKIYAMKYSGCHERLREILDDMEAVKKDLPDATNISGCDMLPNVF